MAAVKQTIETVEALERYKHGFVTDIDQEFAPKGLNADIVRFISAKKDEPEWMLQWRLEAFERWLALEQPPVGLLGWLDALAQGPSCRSQSPDPRTPGTGAGHSYHTRGSAVELKSGACSRLCGLGQATSPL